MRLITVILLFSILPIGCSKEDAQKSTNRTTQSNHSQKPNQLVTSLDTNQTKEATTDSELTYEIQFSREVTYGSTENIIVGSIETFTVDNSNRVYIADGGKTTIHVFNPDGSFLASLGRRGNGPGEFAELNRYTAVTIRANRLFVTDFVADFSKGVQIFLPEELSFSYTMKLIAENRNDYAELQGYLPKRLIPLNEGTFLVSYRKVEYEDKASFVYYVIQDDKGRIVSGPVLKQKGLTYLVHEQSGGYIRRMHSFSFHGKPLLAVSNEDHLYAARTEEFKIEVYNLEGQLVNTIQHPFERRVFDKDKVLERYEETNYMWQLGDGIALEMIRQADNLPQKWLPWNPCFLTTKTACGSPRL